MHTRESIQGLLDRNEKAVERALRTVATSRSGFCFGGKAFGLSLIEWLDSGRRFTPNQLASARKLLRDYTGVLARIANQNDANNAECEREMAAERADELACMVAAERRAERGYQEPEIDW